ERLPKKMLVCDFESIVSAYLGPNVTGYEQYSQGGVLHSQGDRQFTTVPAGQRNVGDEKSDRTPMAVKNGKSVSVGIGYENRVAFITQNPAHLFAVARFIIDQ